LWFSVGDPNGQASNSAVLAILSAMVFSLQIPASFATLAAFFRQVASPLFAPELLELEELVLELDTDAYYLRTFAT